MSEESAPKPLETPVRKNAAVHMKEVNRLLTNKLDDYSDLRELANTSIEMLFQSITGRSEFSGKSMLAEHMGDFFSNMEELAVRHPESAKDIFGTAVIGAAALSLVAYSSTGYLDARQMRTIAPLARKNRDKKDVMDRARSIAAGIWAADDRQVIRISDMAERVYRALTAEGFTEALPGTAERVKEWIKPAAPEYARKGGRRRKPS